MDYVLILFALCTGVVVTCILLKRRSQYFHRIINRLRRKNAQLNAHFAQLTQEEKRLTNSVAALDGQLKVALLQVPIGAEGREQKNGSTQFMEYLVHRGGITSEQLKKIERYKLHTASNMSMEELAVVLDMISTESLQSMKIAFESRPRA